MTAGQSAWQCAGHMREMQPPFNEKAGMASEGLPQLRVLAKMEFALWRMKGLAFLA